ncbi:helix-turn-helix transcriptional regulator [Pseudomonas sp. 681]|uniref:Helix-turn-helix transcriptional regulator n=1 Tax=Pseudomonas fungipugnans TaxID=3024217 RepID=A0ABT6QPF1_9PSED|nr:helix-turn-helix transcriptional regulator [Pseudomonas sp. 681]MDI2589819.1 helix-turn-helix transcriptional regulator [Pseudomonas sp. 681]MDI2592719.1 helix-turn-helix transcriptional regulator [Pseudomonas sp. 681]MDI2592726.1 helix-turn-helix transcriptional regulator [Pseudomonas sp. 681]MDI2595571.1 helix-turn-helix transcriptional regulator [Pseudomonas sp. 681]
MDLNRALGRALRELRQSKGLSQESIGASQSYISDVERGIKTLSVEKLEEFAINIGVHPVTLLTKCYLIKNDDINSEMLLATVHNELENFSKQKE